MQNKKNYNRSKLEILRLLWNIIVFRLVGYLLNMICLNLHLCIYMNIRIILTQFFYQFIEIETSDRCLICIVQNLRFSGFILYPLSFFLYSPFNRFCF